MVKIYNQDGTVQVLEDYKAVAIKGLSLDINGEDNLIELHLPLTMNRVTIKIKGNKNFVDLRESKYQLNNIMINLGFEVDNRSVKIGSRFFCGGLNIVCPDHGNTVEIGDDCVFSDNIEIRSEDGHTIYDVVSGEIVNKSKSGVKIGKHVWISRNVFIGKNVQIADNCIIGHGSVCTKKLDEANCIYAGVPAKKIKGGVNWDRSRISNFAVVPQKTTRKVVAVIPARYASSRFPGKPLAMICGKPMIRHVYERVSEVKGIAQTFVATDDKRIYDAVKEFGGQAVMTGDCSCGTERVYEAVKNIDCDIVLNIQGDEPLIKKQMIELLISAFDDSEVQMATLKKRLESTVDINDPNIAKVVTDVNNNAIMFSRSTIPFNRDKREGVIYFKHIGLYGYTKKFLEIFNSLPQSAIEKAEQLEQMRVIENGYKIRVLETESESVGVDLPAHIAKIEEMINNEIHR